MPRALSAAGVPHILVRSVPPTKRSGPQATGRDLYQSAYQGSARTASSSLLNWPAVKLFIRESPDPSTCRSLPVSTPTPFA